MDEHNVGIRRQRCEASGKGGLPGRPSSRYRTDLGKPGGLVDGWIPQGRQDDNDSLDIQTRDEDPQGVDKNRLSRKGSELLCSSAPEALAGSRGKQNGGYETGGPQIGLGGDFSAAQYFVEHLAGFELIYIGRKGHL